MKVVKMTEHTTEFPGSQKYWEARYHAGGNSGAGSYNRLAHYKATIINDFVQNNKINSVIEHGCGDGNQLSLSNYPEYWGFDISPTAVAMCAARFKHDRTKTFRTAEAYSGEVAELTLSLDVIYHLIEDEVFEAYMKRLFDSSSRFVIIYSSNSLEYNLAPTAPHVKHRAFSEWVSRVCPRWKLAGNIPNIYPYTADDPHNTSIAEFFVYKKVAFRNQTGRSLGRRHRTALEN